MTLPAPKSRGAVYTPEPVSNFIVDWAIRDAADAVLEPSCGEASFLQAAARRFSELASDSLFPQPPDLTGIELHAESADHCTRVLEAVGSKATIRPMDFFDFAPSARFDAIVGNPPYIRYQRFAGVDRAKALRVALAHGVALNGLASSWAAFVVHAAMLLKPSGRLGFVLPAELLTVNYAAPIRRFLLDRFASIKLVTFEQRLFLDAQEEVVLLLAEGAGRSSFFEVYSARSADCLPGLSGDEGWRDISPPEDGRWSSALLSDGTYDTYQDAVEVADFAPMRDWGSVYLGAVTGNNRFFALTADEADEAGLPREDLVVISPPGSRHLRGLTLTHAAWAQLAEGGARCFLFYPSAAPSKVASAFIRRGEKAGVHTAYKCRTRKPWWRVPLVERPDLFMTYMDAQRPRVVKNAAGLAHLNSVYGVRLRQGLGRLGRDYLPLVSMSSLTLLGAELVGRSYGGGMLKFEPREADRLPVPSPALVRSRRNELRGVLPQAVSLLTRGQLAEASELVDRALFADDKQVDLSAIRAARQHLWSRREARSR